MHLKQKKVLVTGAAGFIGFHLVKSLLQHGVYSIGLDNINSYYDVNLKYARIDILKQFSKENNTPFDFTKESLENKFELEKLFSKYRPDIVVNLAAQAGVRFSLENPSAYVQSNLVGFGNLLEICRKFEIKHLVYASSSSVYGGNTKMPFSENHSVDHPISLYAATKKANELMAHTYSHLYHLPTTGLRFFTVYGPWGRPDMAPMIFARSILRNEPIKVFNYGKMQRDFT